MCRASKSPYLFEWLGLGERASEAELECGLLGLVERFLLEMGQGFALVSRQHHLEVGGQDFYLDLLLYQLQLRCYVVVELKLGEFRPEYVWKLGFYLAAVDELVRGEQDSPSIGLILCKDANETVVQYTLREPTWCGFPRQTRSASRRARLFAWRPFTGERE